MPSTTEEKDIPPLSLLRRYSQEFPHAWRELARMRERRGKDLPWWPDWCYVPIAGAIAVITEGAPLPFGPEEFAKMTLFPPAVMAALAAWRQTKGIYRFDPTLVAEIAGMPLDGTLPAQVFYSLPEWCIYVETPGMALHTLQPGEVNGFFAHLEFDVNDNRHELRFLFLLADGTIFPWPLHLGEWTVAEAIDRVLRHSKVDVFQAGATANERDQLIARWVEDLVPYINLVLYICSANADFGTQRPVHPAKRTSSGKKKKITAADQIRVWDVGIRLGPALRRAAAAAEQPQEPATASTEKVTEARRASPRPHWRRGHWHHYWIGPRSRPEERKIILHWLPPIPVGVPEFDMPEMPAVVRRVVKGTSEGKDEERE